MQEDYEIIVIVSLFIITDFLLTAPRMQHFLGEHAPTTRLGKSKILYSYGPGCTMQGAYKHVLQDGNALNQLSYSGYTESYRVYIKKKVLQFWHVILH
jgi:hypothetical protein